MEPTPVNVLALWIGYSGKYPPWMQNVGECELNFAYKERSRVKITAPLPAYSDA